MPTLYIHGDSHHCALAPRFQAAARRRARPKQAFDGQTLVKFGDCPPVCRDCPPVCSKVASGHTIRARRQRAAHEISSRHSHLAGPSKYGGAICLHTPPRPDSVSRIDRPVDATSPSNQRNVSTSPCAVQAQKRQNTFFPCAEGEDLA